MENNPKAYIQANKERFLSDLFAKLRIPSISSQSEHKPDMDRMAAHWRDYLLKSGMQKAEVFPTAGNSIVYAERIIDPKAKTILIYGHYDVMPVEPLDLWESAPFEPEIRDGHVWARGADDDKGQTMIQALGFQTALAMGWVQCNVKVIFEGEEEIGSTNLDHFCKEHREMLQADVIIVSDTGMLGAETPSLTAGLRGLAYWEIEVTE